MKIKCEFCGAEVDTEKAKRCPYANAYVECPNCGALLLAKDYDYVLFGGGEREDGAQSRHPKAWGRPPALSEAPTREERK